MADGNYITEAQQQASLARQLNLWNDTSNTFSLAYMNADRDEVEALIDAHLRRRYTVPLTDATAINILKGMVVDLMQYKGYKRNGPGEVPEAIADAAERAFIMLNQLKNGDIVLPGVSETVDPEGPEAQIFASSNTPNFTETKLSGY